MFRIFITALIASFVLISCNEEPKSVEKEVTGNSEKQSKENPYIKIKLI